jgi:hypothetical protein
MAYPDKINWSDPRKGSDLLSFDSIPEPFKSAVLDYHIQIEGQLEDIIKLAFRDPKRFKVNGFGRKVDFIRALIGETPDDEIWLLVGKLADLRNEFAHGTPAPQTIQPYIDDIQKQIQKIGPGYIVAAGLYDDKRLDILASAHFVAMRFFREIKEWLSNQPAT